MGRYKVDPVTGELIMISPSLEDIPIFQGVNGSMMSVSGMVPEAQAGDEDKVFQGNGTWGHKLQIDIVKHNGVYGYIDSGGNFVAFKSQADIDAAVAAAMVGTATAADVKEGKTFTNSTTSGVTGTFAAQEKSATPATTAQDITPDSGKYLSKVSVGAISPLRTTNSLIVPRWGTGAGSNVPATKVATENPRVDFGNNTTYGSAEMVEIAPPQGYYAWSYGKSGICIPTETKTVTAGTSATSVAPTEYNTSGKYVKFLKSVTVNPTPSQTKSTTSSRTAQTITPDSGKLLSSVSIAKYPDASGTYTPTANSSASDMGATNNYRYVDTRTVYNLGVAAGYTTVVQISSTGGSASAGYTYSATNGHLYLVACFNIKGISIVSGASSVTGNKGAFNTYWYFNIIKATATTMKIKFNGNVSSSISSGSLIIRLY